jgi:hypothetical protein
MTRDDRVKCEIDECHMLWITATIGMEFASQYSTCCNNFTHGRRASDPEQLIKRFIHHDEGFALTISDRLR